MQAFEASAIISVLSGDVGAPLQIVLDNGSYSGAWARFV